MPEYEIVDIKRYSDSGLHPTKEQKLQTSTTYNIHTPEGSLLQFNNPVEYLTPVITNKVAPHDTQAQLTTEATSSDENTYQPLIPARAKEKTISTEYQSLTQFAALQRPDLPPPIPPKPKKF